MIHPKKIEMDGFICTGISVNLTGVFFLFCFGNLHKYVISHEVVKVSWVYMVVYFSLLYVECGTVLNDEVLSFSSNLGQALHYTWVLK